MIVLNSLNDEGAGFGHDTNKITIFRKEGKEIQFDTKSKEEVAKDIVDTIIQFILCLKRHLYSFVVSFHWIQLHRRRKYRQGLL